MVGEAAGWSQRNIIVHVYWRIDHDVVWATIHTTCRLADDIAALLDDGPK